MEHTPLVQTVSSPAGCHSDGRTGGLFGVVVLQSSTSSILSLSSTVGRPGPGSYSHLKKDTGGLQPTQQVTNTAATFVRREEQLGSTGYFGR